MEELRKYSDKVDRIIKSAINSIDDDASYGLMLYLLEEGDKKFKDIQEKFGIETETAFKYLSRLESGGLVGARATVYICTDKNGEKTIKVDPLDETIYGVTLLGYDFMKGIYDGLMPMTKGGTDGWKKPEPTLK